MSATILSRTISSTLDKKLVLPFAEAARTMSFGNNWSSLVIGMRYAFVDTGANIPGGPLFWFGLMSQPVETAGVLSNGLLAPSTTHFIGIHAGGGFNFVRSVSPVRYSVLTGFYRKVGSLATDSMAGTYVHSADPTVRICFIMTLTKSAGVGGEVGMVCVGNLDGIVDVPSVEILKLAMGEATPAAMAISLNTSIGAVGYGIATQSAGFNESAGPLDSIIVSWNKDVVLEVSEVLFRRIS